MGELEVRILEYFNGGDTCGYMYMYKNCILDLIIVFLDIFETNFLETSQSKVL